MISKQLGDLLVERKVITQSQLDTAIKVQKDKGGLLGQVLVMLGYVKEEEIAQAITLQYGFPFLPLENYEINQEALTLVNANVARQYNLIPVDRIGELLTVAMSNPLNSQAIEDIEMITHCKIQVFVSTAMDINQTIKSCYAA